VTDDGALLRQLLDLEGIKQLKARYFRAIDTKQWDDFGKVFARDAVMEVPEVDMTKTGRDEIVAFVSTALTGARTVHHGHMPEIDLTSGTTATGVWAMEDLLRWPAGGPFGSMHGWGHYHETYTKEGGSWRIQTLALTRLRRDIA